MNSPASEPNSMARALFLFGAAVSTPAFAEEPSVPPTTEVAAPVANTSERAKMTVISVCGDLGAGLKTLDSATATVQGGAAYGALDVCADVHPLPFRGLNGFYIGGEADGRFSGQGWGVGAAEAEVGYDFGRFGLDIGGGAYWDVLDGNRADTNVDGVPHTSLDLYLRPFPETSKVSPLTVDLSLGSQWPQGTYAHPAYWSLHLGVGGTWEVVKVNTPAPRVNEPKADEPKADAVVEVKSGLASSSLVTAEPVASQPVMSIPELPRFVDLKDLPESIAAQRAQMEKMVRDFYVSDPGVKTMHASYLTEVEAPHFLNSTYYKKVTVEGGDGSKVVHYDTMNSFEVPNLSPEIKAKLYLGNLAFQASYTTQDGKAEKDSEEENQAFDPNAPQQGISDTIEVSFSYNYEEVIAFVTALDAYVAQAEEAGFSVDPAVLSEYVLLQRMIPQLKAEIHAEIQLNDIRYKAYFFAQSEQRKISEWTYLGANDRDACPDNSACAAQAEEVRLSDELKKNLKFAKPATLTFSNYEGMLQEASKGALLTVEDYRNGVSASLGVGRVDMALKAAEQLVRREYSPKAVDQLIYLQKNYGLVHIKGSGVVLINPAYDPNARFAVDYANKELEKGEFNGYLPVGTYTLPDGTSFEVKPGGKNKQVR